MDKKMDVIFKKINMKILLLLSCIFMLFSCDKDENNIKNSQNVISCDELSQEDQMIYQCKK